MRFGLESSDLLEVKGGSRILVFLSVSRRG